MCRSFILRSPVTFLLVALSMAPCAASVVYVDARATGANDGTSWADAYNCLQDALMFAAEGDEIHVAQGIYRPALSGGDRQATFQLVDGVMLRGGFTGLGAPDPDARDIQVWETILSGDLNGDDSENPESWVDNSYHVVIAKTARSVLLDGLEITGGNADGVEYSQQCGGGVFADGGLEMVQCRLVGNRAHYGGGLFCRPTSEDVPVLHIRDCRVEDNQAVMDGGGSYLYGSDVHFEDCVIEENRAVRHGGGVYEEDGHSRYLNCLLQGNEASFYIPGIPSHCGNGGAICSIGGRTHATDCRFAGNRASQGGAWFQREGTMQAQRDRFHLNWAWDCGGGMYLLSAEGEVEHCEFVRNCADDWGGGAIWNSQGTLRVLHCSMAGNRASDGGSGVYIYDHAHAVVINSIIRDSLAAGNYSYFAISYSNIVGAESYSGVGTIDADPGFRARPSGGCLGDEEGSLGDLRLSPGSPCINAGDTSAVSPGAVDLDGRPRVYGDIVDMGAYEYADLRTVYVDNRATGANDGTSWADAYNCLQDALMFAAEGDEIHVAQGVYRPDQFMLSDRPNLGRAESFHLRSGVAIRGGYAGLGAPNPDARDTERYETILTGDRLGNDVALAGTEWEQVDDFVRSDTLLDNCVTVITGVDVDASAVLDGVVITGGNANCYGGPRGRPESVGGGMYLVSASPTMVDCVFRANMSQALWWIDYGLPAPPPDPEEEWPYLVRQQLLVVT